MSLSNNVTLKGRFTAEPEIRNTPNGKKNLYFTIAVSKKYKDSTGELKEKVNYLDCVAYEPNSERIAKFFSKGDEILIGGELTSYSTQDRGEKRTKMIVELREWEFGQKKKENNDSFAEKNEYPSNEYSKWETKTNNLDSFVTPEELPFY